MLSPDSPQSIKNLTPPGTIDLDQLADEFIAKIRQGDKPEISDYADRYPELAGEIEEIFPAIVALEGGKHAAQAQGKVSLGASAPEQLGDFKIVREIGRGGMGVVYEAIQESLNRRVALKLLPRHSLLDDKQLKRFRREAELTASLHHTNIVPVFGVGENGNFHYYVMQLIEGVGLDELTQKIVATAEDTEFKGQAVKPGSETQTGTDISTALDETIEFQPLERSDLERPNSADFAKFVATPANIAQLGIQAANALQYAHDRGILHRDIKPGNLLLDRDGLLCITDFGLARAAEQSDLSKSTDIVGTLGYMAPEMFRGDTCRQSDIYGLGITLYELLTKRFAIERTSRHAMIEQITHGTITSLRRINPRIPRDLETIILKAIATDTKHRYQSASELAEDLKRFLENRPIRAKRVSPIEYLWRWSCRNPAVASLSGLALLLMLALGISMAVGFERERRERKKAEASAQLATNALDRVFDRFVPARLHSTEVSGGGDGYGEPVLSRESADLLAGMVQFYEQLADSTGEQEEFQNKAANAQRKIGDIHRRLGDFHSALISYQKSLNLYQQNTGESNALIIANLCNEIGRTFRYLGQQNEATEAHERAEKLLRSTITAHPDQEDLQFELARTYFLKAIQFHPDQLGNAMPEMDLSSPPEGSRPSENDQLNVQQAIEILEKLIKSDQTNPEYRYLLALCLQEQIPADYARTSQDLKKQARALEILETLVQEHPHVADYRQAVVKSYERIDIRRVKPEEIDQSVIQRLEKAIQHASRLVSDYPTIPEYKISLIHAHNKLAHGLNKMTTRPGDSDEIRTRHDTAELSLRTAVRLQKELIIQFPDTPDHRIWLAKFQSELAEVLNKKGSENEAISLLQSSIKILQPELQADPNSQRVYTDLIHSLEELARTYHHAGNEVESWLMWDQHDQLMEEFRKKFPNAVYHMSNGHPHSPHDGPRRGEHGNRPPRGPNRPGPPRF
ncbi:protein kinase domain-containing protein [Gimesia sp.]|uniref:protein kinase domain-containing protein n=1 Tax=Gimesia sp. TaxID=2024833 RepID=UPI003A8C9904